MTSDSCLLFGGHPIVSGWLGGYSHVFVQVSTVTERTHCHWTNITTSGESSE